MPATQSWPERAVVGLMAHEDPAFRIDDPATLRELVAAAGRWRSTPARRRSRRRPPRWRAVAPTALSRRASRSPRQRAPGAAAARRRAVALDRASARRSRARAGRRGAEPRRPGDARGGGGRPRRPDRRSAAGTGRSDPADDSARSPLRPGRHRGPPPARAAGHRTAPRDGSAERRLAGRRPPGVAHRSLCEASLCRELGRDDEALEGFDGIWRATPEPPRTYAEGPATIRR